MRLMLLGSRLEPIQEWKPTAHGDNFWLDMIPALLDKIEQVVVVSIGGKPSQNARPVPTITIFPIEIRNEKLISILEPNYFLKTMLFAGTYPSVTKLIKKYRIDVVHLIDNFGPVQIALRQVKVAKTTFQLHYDPRYPIYDELLRISLDPFDALVTGSVHLAEKLRSLRVGPRMIETIPWGVSLDSLRNKAVNQAETKTRLGVKPDAKVVLWSGFISTVVEKPEFLFSVRVAKRLLSHLSNIVWIFAFKSMDFDRQYKQFEEDRIRVISLRSKTEFLEVVRVSTLLFSPCLNTRAVIGPPLTWLECMALGVPIVTTSVAGVDDIIYDNRNGIILSDPKNAADMLCELLHDPARMERLAAAARQTIGGKFGIDKAAKAYTSLWSSLVKREE